jgi:hypothetical protein
VAGIAEGQLLADQSRAVKEVAEYVSQLRRVGQGLGVFEVGAPTLHCRCSCIWIPPPQCTTMCGCPASTTAKAAHPLLFQSQLKVTGLDG